MWRKAFLAAAVTMAVSTSAMASVFVWTDPVDNLKVTFPQDWVRQTNANPEARLVILAPQGNGMTACRVLRKQDNAFLSTPQSGEAEVSAFRFDEKYVSDYLFRAMDVSALQLTNFNPDAGYGHAPATSATATFTKQFNGRDLDMTALAFFSQHRGVQHVFVCETMTQALGRWQPIFENILRSVEFPAAYGITPSGSYRRFHEEGGVIFPVNKRKTGQTIE